MKLSETGHGKGVSAIRGLLNVPKAFGTCAVRGCSRPAHHAVMLTAETPHTLHDEQSGYGVSGYVCEKHR